MVNDRFNLCKRSSAFRRWSQRNSSHIKDKMRLNLKICLIANGCCMQMNFIVTNGPRADCKWAIHFIDDIDTKLVFADRACDTNEILFYLNQRNIKSIISPKCNGLDRRDYKGFKVLKKSDNSLIKNFIVFVISLKILFLL